MPRVFLVRTTPALTCKRRLRPCQGAACQVQRLVRRPAIPRQAADRMPPRRSVDITVTALLDDPPSGIKTEVAYPVARRRRRLRRVGPPFIMRPNPHAEWLA